MKTKKWQEMTLKEKVTAIVVLVLTAFIVIIVIAGLFSGNKKEAKPEALTSIRTHWLRD